MTRMITAATAAMASSEPRPALVDSVSWSWSGWLCTRALSGSGDIATRRCDRAGHRRDGRVQAQQDEGGGRRQQGAGPLSADRPSSCPGQELPDIADAKQVADQQVLGEQEPDGDADQGWNLVANDGTQPDTDRRPESRGYSGTN